MGFGNTLEIDHQEHCNECCPYRSTDKPHIEHANALIRQYLPKHASFAKLTTKEIKDIECALNNRPRKKLGYRQGKRIKIQTHYECRRHDTPAKPRVE